METSDNAHAVTLDLSDALADAVEAAGAFTVGVDGRGRLGSSGIVWATDVIVTANHTIEREEDITVTRSDGQTLDAALVGRDPGSDIAVLRVTSGSGGTEAAPARRTASPRVGALVLAIGRPGRAGRHDIGASWGIVSAIGSPRRGRRRLNIDGLLRPDLTMYPGFSGGPLVDVSGKLIGMNTSGMGGQALTIPAAAADPIIEQLLAHGRLKRGYLGLTSQVVGLPEPLAGMAGQSTGLLVVGVEDGSPAAMAGAIVGDILVGIGSMKIRDTDDLREALDAEQVGQATYMHLIRGGETRRLDVTIGER